MIKNYERLIEIGYALKSKTYVGGRCFHLSGIFHRSKLLSLGVNEYNKTHTSMLKFGYSAMSGIHSELRGALKLGFDNCSGLTIINIRIDGRNNINNSCFCNACQKLVRYLGFKNAFFSDWNGQIEEFSL